MATITVGPSGRNYTTILAAIRAANDNPTSRATMDIILVDPGTYTEMLDFQSLSGGWQIPCIVRAANPANRPIIASTGAAQACQGGAAYRSTAGGETTLEDLIFSGWTNATNGVLYFSIAGIVVKRCHFVGNTGRTVMRWIGGSTTRLGLVDSCTFETSGSSGTGEKGIILTWTAYADVKNCKAICPLNVQFHNDAYSGSRYVEHNSVYGTWSSTVKVFTGVGTFRGNLIYNAGTGASHAIDASGGGTYTENIAYGTFTTRFAGIDGGSNQNADPLFVDGPGGDLTLELTSPAIRSLARSANTLLDIEGDSRSDPTDAGAYEMVLDVVPPTVTRARMTGKTTIEITFSEDVEETSAETTGNYTLVPGVSFTATLTDTDTVVLTLTPGVDAVRLTVDNVEDLAGNAMAAAYSTELGYALSDGSADLPIGVTASGAAVDYLRTWDPMPSGVGSELTIERLVFVSLMSDARINADETPVDGTGDRRGWWGDTYADRPDNTGSRLWHLLSRAGVQAREFEDAVRAALQWMITDRLCSGIVPVATIRANRVSITVEITLSSGELLTIPYPDLWSEYAR